MQSTENKDMPDDAVTVKKSFIYSLAEAIYVRYEILAYLAGKNKMKEMTERKAEMTQRIIHCAGHPIGLHFEKNQQVVRVIQRCAICGELLLQKKVRRKSRKTFWDHGDLVEFLEDGRPVKVLAPDNNLLPEETCAKLVEGDHLPDPPEADEDDEEEDDE